MKKSKVGIIGAGFVGGAIQNAHDIIGDEVVVKDPKFGEASASYEDLFDCDAIFIAVPSPSCQDGSCNTAILETVLKELDSYEPFKSIPWISKCTAPPSFYEAMSKKYTNLVYVPEFLTAVNANEDYRWTDFIIAGGTDVNHVDAAVDVIMPSINMKEEMVYFTDAKTASMVKYIMNTYLATKVTMMNEYKFLCDKLGIDWDYVRDMITYDDRIGVSHTQVPGPDGLYGFGGACFPKEMAAMIHEAQNHGLHMNVIEVADRVNNFHRKMLTNKPF